MAVGEETDWIAAGSGDLLKSEFDYWISDRGWSLTQPILAEINWLTFFVWIITGIQKYLKENSNENIQFFYRIIVQPLYDWVF